MDNVSKNISFRKNITSNGTDEGNNLGNISGGFDTNSMSLNFNIQLNSKPTDNDAIKKQVTDFITYLRIAASNAGLTEFSE